MKSRFLLILLAALYAGVGAYAATVTVTVDGSASTYTLNGVSVDANGNTNVSATSISEGGTTPPPVTTYTLNYYAGTGGTLSGSNFQSVSAGGSGTAVTAVANTGYTFANWSDGVTTASRTDSNVQASLSVTANFSVVVSGNCPTPGSNVQIVDTNVPTTTFPKTLYNNLTPSTIQAFKFTTRGAGTAGLTASVRTSSSPSAKMVVISECPGDVRIDDKASFCYNYVYEGTSVPYVVGIPSATRYCQLDANKVYYANMVAQNTTTVGTTSYTCTSATTCSHTVDIK